MDDSKINLAIAKIEWGNEFFEDHDMARSYNRKDWCNNWSDIGPIIEREKIDLRFYELPQAGKWCAVYAYDENIFAKAETPTKAAALCYLKMKEAEL